MTMTRSYLCIRPISIAFRVGNDVVDESALYRVVRRTPSVTAHDSSTASLRTLKAVLIGLMHWKDLAMLKTMYNSIAVPTRSSLA